MTNAKRDQNRVATLMGVSSVDSVTPAIAQINPITDGVKMTARDRSITATVGTVGKRDQNRVRTSYGVSSADGTTPVPLHVSPQGELLIEIP